MFATFQQALVTTTLLCLLSMYRYIVYWIEPLTHAYCAHAYSWLQYTFTFTGHHTVLRISSVCTATQQSCNISILMIMHATSLSGHHMATIIGKFDYTCMCESDKVAASTIHYILTHYTTDSS